MLSGTFGEGEDNEEPIDLPHVKSSILQMIIDWCILHIDCPTWEDNVFHEVQELSRLGPRDTDYFNTHREYVFDIMVGAYYLNIADLVSACALKVALEIRNKSVEELQARFL